MKKLLLMIMTLLFTLSAFADCNLEYNDPGIFEGKYANRIERMYKRILRRKGYTFNTEKEGALASYDIAIACGESESFSWGIVTIESKDSAIDEEYESTSDDAFLGFIVSEKALIRRALKKIPHCKLANKL